MRIACPSRRPKALKEEKKKVGQVLGFEMQRSRGKKKKTGEAFLLTLVDVSDIFYFFCLWRRKEESEAKGGGGSIFLIENPRVFRRERG